MRLIFVENIVKVKLKLHHVTLRNSFPLCDWTSRPTYLDVIFHEGGKCQQLSRVLF